MTHLNNAPYHPVVVDLIINTTGYSMTTEYLTIKDLAARLKISVTTVNELRRKRLLPSAMMVGGSPRWFASEVDQYLSDHARDTR